MRPLVATIAALALFVCGVLFGRFEANVNPRMEPKVYFGWKRADFARICPQVAIFAGRGWSVEIPAYDYLVAMGKSGDVFESEILRSDGVYIADVKSPDYWRVLRGACNAVEKDAPTYATDLMFRAIAKAR